MKRVDKRKSVSLQTNLAVHDTDRTSRSSRETSRLRGQDCCQISDRAVGDPVAALHLKAKQKGVQVLAFSDKVAHQRHADLAGKESRNVEECGKRQNASWRFQASREEGLQHD